MLIGVPAALWFCDYFVLCCFGFCVCLMVLYIAIAVCWFNSVVCGSLLG